MSSGNTLRCPVCGDCINWDPCRCQQGCSDCGSPFDGSHAGDCPAAKRGNFAKAQEAASKPKCPAHNVCTCLGPPAWQVGDRAVWGSQQVKIDAAGPTFCAVTTENRESRVVRTNDLTRPAPKKRVVTVKEYKRGNETIWSEHVGAVNPDWHLTARAPHTFEVEGEDNE